MHWSIHIATTIWYVLDFGLDVATSFFERTGIPWLISNILDNETGKPLGGGLETHMMEWGGKTIGFVSIMIIIMVFGVKVL